jgi:D-alanyl-D-alanine carboxypeptidase
MNTKAQELQLEKSVFSNPTGLDANGHVTTARDLVKVSIVAMKNPFFRQAVRTEEISVKSIDQKINHKLVNINELLGGVDGVLGIKTG